MTLRISVVGTGYLGATHAACMAELGHEVVGVDSDAEKVAALTTGCAPFSEPGLDALLGEHVATGRLRFTTDLTSVASWADVHFVCVGTPQAAQGEHADLGAVEAVVHALAASATRDCLVVGKSTVPAGTTTRLRGDVARLARPGVRVGLAWNPEFLREGHAVEDTLRPDRLVLGADDHGAEVVMRAVYRDLLDAGVPVHVTDPTTAELAKGAANAFLATKISFVNALAEMCDAAGADVTALADVLGSDPRIGRRFLDAGLGFGGGCLPKDIRALGARADELGTRGVGALLREVDRVNLGVRERVVRLAGELAGGDVRGRRVAVLGAAFKPGSDDVRDSPALDVATRLHRAGASVSVYDPEALATGRAVAPELRFVAAAETALRDADLVLHLTEWPEFADLDPTQVATLVRGRVLLDARNRLDLARWATAGWTVRGLGTPRLGADGLRTGTPDPGARIATVPDAWRRSGPRSPEFEPT